MREGFYNGRIVRGHKDYLIWSLDKGVMAEFDTYPETKTWCSEYFRQHPDSKLFILILSWTGDGWKGEEVCVKPILPKAGLTPAESAECKRNSSFE